MLTSHRKHGRVAGGRGGRRDKRSLMFFVLETARETYFFFSFFFFPLFFRRSLRFSAPETFQSVILQVVQSEYPFCQGGQVREVEVTLCTGNIFVWS